MFCPTLKTAEAIHASTYKCIVMLETLPRRHYLVKEFHYIFHLRESAKTAQDFMNGCVPIVVPY